MKRCEWCGERECGHGEVRTVRAWLDELNKEPEDFSWVDPDYATIDVVRGPSDALEWYDIQQRKWEKKV